MSDTPETAASLQEATITVSAMPMVMASACSIISGTSSRRRSFRLNILSNLRFPFSKKNHEPLLYHAAAGNANGENARPATGGK